MCFEGALEVSFLASSLLARNEFKELFLMGLQHLFSGVPGAVLSLLALVILGRIFYEQVPY